MDPFATSHFSDRALLCDTKRLVERRCTDTAMLLTRIAEIDERQLYRRAGYPSLYAFCLGELHMLEDSAYRHINAARIARRFPAVLIALAEGRLHTRAVLMLAPHLTSGNVDELLAAATHKSRFEIQQLLAERFPQPDLPERLQALPTPPTPTPTAPPDPAAVTLSAPERIRMTIP